MTKAEILKREILTQYRSLRQFAIEMEIPYSTLVTALERGIEGMAYGTVIRMCGKLNLNPIDFTSLERDTTISEQLLENRVMQYYVKMNAEGRDKILGIMEDYSEIEKYKNQFYVNKEIKVAVAKFVCEFNNSHLIKKLSLEEHIEKGYALIVSWKRLFGVSSQL